MYYTASHNYTYIFLDHYVISHIRMQIQKLECSLVIISIACWFGGISIACSHHWLLHGSLSHTQTHTHVLTPHLGVNTKYSKWRWRSCVTAEYYCIANCQAVWSLQSSDPCCSYISFLWHTVYPMISYGLSASHMKVFSNFQTTSSITAKIHSGKQLNSKIKLNVNE